LLTRRFNQDALENFFGNVRNQSGNSYNPTPIQFYYAFKKLYSVDYDKINDTGNTAPDTDSILLQYKDYEETRRPIFETPSKTAVINVDVDNYDYRSMPVTEENVFNYICGYLLRRTFIKHYCDVCASLANYQIYIYFLKHIKVQRQITSEIYIY